ncbi:hypothetical protein ACFX11_036855 [Malus domestica]
MAFGSGVKFKRGRAEQPHNVGKLQHSKLFFDILKRCLKYRETDMFSLPSLKRLKKVSEYRPALSKMGLIMDPLR